MDETAYRATRSAVNPMPCAFEKALLARCVVCELASRQALAERETIACTSPLARTNCATLVGLLRERSTFTLKLSKPGDPIAHAAAIKLQCGGLKGLQQAVGTGEADVHRLLVAARERWGSLTELPWPEIVRSVAAWQGRRRRPAAENP